MTMPLIGFNIVWWEGWYNELLLIKLINSFKDGFLSQKNIFIMDVGDFYFK